MTDTLPTWQPIETAPRDGTPILTFSDECGALEAFLVCWWSEAKAEKSGFGWCAYGVDHMLSPDFWMPLPHRRKGRHMTDTSKEAVEADMAEETEKTMPDWKGFGQAIMEEWWMHGDIEASEKFDLARRFNILEPIPGGFDPESHYDETGEAEAGDPWYQLNRADEQSTSAEGEKS